MDTKRWALFFIFLVCSGHIGSSYGNRGGVETSKSVKGCVIEGKLISVFDGCIEKLKLKVQREQQVKEVVVKNYKASDCYCEGLNQIKRTGCSCTCYEDFIRIFISVSIFEVVFSFILSLDGILGGILSGVIDPLVDILREVVNLLVKVSCLTIDLVIVVDGHFDDGRCFVREIHKPRIGEIKILNIGLTGLLDALGGILGYILSAILDILITNDFRSALIEVFNEAIIDNNWHSCPLR